MIPSTELSWVPLPERARLYGDVELASALRRRSKFFVTFLGFGELGYQDENAMRSIVLRDLETRSRADTIVNSGTLITAGFHPGIAEVYREARAMGFATTGIHPSIALRDPSRHCLSPYVDEAFFVEDDSWGGYLPGTCEPSPTLRALVAVSNQVLVIGGGRHTADEMREFLHRGVPMRYYEAEMNHDVGVAWYRTRGVTHVDFRGEAYLFWQSTRGQ